MTSCHYRFKILGYDKLGKEKEKVKPELKKRRGRKPSIKQKDSVE